MQFLVNITYLKELVIISFTLSEEFSGSVLSAREGENLHILDSLFSVHLAERMIYYQLFRTCFNVTMKFSASR